MSLSIKLGKDDPQFHWGRKRGIGGPKKNFQFYESFTYDNIEYSLYDCVYLYKKGEDEAYIGKLVKIWERPDHRKIVKILWFFRPSEVQNYLRDYEILEKEIFLASGEGVGLTNCNPLEAIAGKCHVVCTSMDKRNLQPSSTEVELADYIFYRIFDVGNYTISDVLADKIAGIEVKFLLNQNKDLNSASGSKVDANGILHGQKDASDDFLLKDSKSEPLKSLENQMNKDSPRTAINSLPMDDVNEGNYPGEAKSFSFEKPPHKSISGCIADGTAVDVLGSCDEKKPKYSSKDLVNPTLSDERPSKKIRLIEDTFNSSSAMQRDMIEFGLRKQKVEHNDTNSFQSQKGPTEKICEKSAKFSDEPLKKASPACSAQCDEKADSQIFEVTRRPEVDRSKWFKGLTWDSKIKKANEAGTLVFLDNVDPSYTSKDIEGMIFFAFKLNCTAKVIPQTAFHDPNYGEAYVVFKTSDMADLVVQKINEGCLMQENGRPLVCSKGILKMPLKSSSKFTGHLVIDKVRRQMQRDEAKAVSTSHCSQPNTIEYEMAMEWILAQERSAASLGLLNKEHSDEIRQPSHHPSSPRRSLEGCSVYSLCPG
ncbi:hypothetical protein J5N97_019218 [Dioscorea zingiberensis]|uniref:BAH domain-containing protein n=1 Tax=Dioscorea zingiberensis TaxID=325984 RepID=A0A9D5CE76_9LILI|nr:hypothetical protein J5N97_019218 [Dioscorea zingiberensis]